MSSSDHTNDSGSGDRAERLRKIVDKYRQHLLEGGNIAAESIVARFPDLMPELERELAKVRDSEAVQQRRLLARPAPLPGVSGKAPNEPATDGRSRKTQAVQSEEVSTGPESAAKPPSTLSAGSVSPDRFAIIGELGAGAFGTVYRARDTQLDREVALKIPKMGVLGSERDAQRFLREARAAGNLRHPNIVPIYDAGRIGESYFIASGFIEGQTLSERIAGDERLTHRECAALIQKLAGALHYAHTKGIVHRDVKPANVMIDSDGEPLVMDFGMARRDEGEALRTQEGMHIGTPAYMSPEQHAGQSHLADARSDQWALGVMLYELLTGRRPFTAPTLVQVAYQVRQTEPERPRKLDATISKDLETICLKCLEKEPERRYVTCQQLAEELARYQRGEPIEARPIGQGERFVRWCRRNPVVAGLVATVFAVLVMGVAISTVFAVVAANRTREAEHERQRASDAADDLRESLVETRFHKQRAEEEKLRADERALAANEARDETLSQLARAENLVYCLHFSSAWREWQNGDGASAWHHFRLCDAKRGRWEYEYLRKRMTEGYQVINPRLEDDVASCLALSNDGRLCVVGASDFSLRLWSTESWGEPKVLRGHSRPVDCVGFSGDGKRIVSVARDKTMRIWDTATGAEIKSISIKTLRLWKAWLSPDGELAASQELQHLRDMVTVWNVDTGNRIRTMTRKQDFPAAAFSADGKQLILAGGGVIIYGDVEAGTARTTESGPASILRMMCISPDRKRIVTGGADAAVRIWDAETGAEIAIMKGHRLGVNSVAYSLDGKQIVSGGADGNVKLWDSETGAELRTMKGHQSSVFDVKFSPTGKSIVSGARDMEVRRWDVKAIPTARVIEGCSASGSFLSPDGKTVAGDQGNSLTLWNVDTGEKIRDFGPASAGGHSLVALHPDGQRITTFESALYALHLVNTENGTESLRLQHGHRNQVTSLAFSRDGRQLASASWDKTVKIWDLETGAAVKTFPHPDWVNGVCFSPDGKCVVSAARDGKLRLWDVASGSETRTMKGHMGAVNSVAFAPGGEFIVSGGDDHTVRLWDATSGATTKTLRGHSDFVSDVDVDREGKRVVSASHDTTLKIWDVETGTDLLTLEGHTDKVHDVIYSPDGRRILSAADDRTLRIWEIEKSPTGKSPP